MMIHFRKNTVLAVVVFTMTSLNSQSSAFVVVPSRPASCLVSNRKMSATSSSSSSSNNKKDKKPDNEDPLPPNGARYIDYMRLPKSQSNSRPRTRTFSNSKVSSTQSQATQQTNSNENNVEYRRKGYELRWQAMNSAEECKLGVEDDMTAACGGECDACHGEGTLECRFCNGTGFSMLSNGTILTRGQQCLVCSGEGEERCKKCMGNGFIAGWKSLAP